MLAPGFRVAFLALRAKVVTPKEVRIEQLVDPQIIDFKDSKCVSADLRLAAPHHTDLGVDDQLVTISPGTESVQHERRGAVLRVSGGCPHPGGTARTRGSATDAAHPYRADPAWPVHQPPAPPHP